jgi:hypothetical protein
MRSEDQAYLVRVQEALAQSDVKAQVSIVPVSEAISSLGADKVGALLPLWDRYGAAVAPVMLIDGELVLYGGVPTKERIVEVVSKYNRKSQQVEEKADDKGKPHPENERKV